MLCCIYLICYYPKWHWAIKTFPSEKSWLNILAESRNLINFSSFHFEISKATNQDPSMGTSATPLIGTPSLTGGKAVAGTLSPPLWGLWGTEEGLPSPTPSKRTALSTLLKSCFSEATAVEYRGFKGQVHGARAQRTGPASRATGRPCSWGPTGRLFSNKDRRKVAWPACLPPPVTLPSLTLTPHSPPPWSHHDHVLAKWFSVDSGTTVPGTARPSTLCPCWVIFARVCFSSPICLSAPW